MQEKLNRETRLRIIPAHQKKPKTRHYLVILFLGSCIFRVFN